MARTLLVVTTLVVIGSIGYVFFLMGSPNLQRDIRLDRDRISNLVNIADNIDTYWELNEALPQDLNDLYGRSYYVGPGWTTPRRANPTNTACWTPLTTSCVPCSPPPTTIRAGTTDPFPSECGTTADPEGRNCFQLEARAP